MVQFLHATTASLFFHINKCRNDLFLINSVDFLQFKIEKSMRHNIDNGEVCSFNPTVYKSPRFPKATSIPTIPTIKAQQRGQITQFRMHHMFK